MTDDPHGTRDIPVGTPVRAFNGAELGYVREVHPHYLLDEVVNWVPRVGGSLGWRESVSDNRTCNGAESTLPPTKSGSTWSLKGRG